MGGGVIAGVDEVGRGALAGSVVVAAVVLPTHEGIEGLADSKTLSPERRSELAARIRARALGWALGEATAAEVDRWNVLEATLSAMRRAVAGLAALRGRPSLVLVDGNRCPPGLPCPARAVVGGDATVAAIGAASILAKVYRDGEMVRLDRHWPRYGFAGHKGYPTAAHLERMDRFGPCPLHRRTFAPVRLRSDRGA